MVLRALQSRIGRKNGSPNSSVWNAKENRSEKNRVFFRFWLRNLIRFSSENSGLEMFTPELGKLKRFAPELEKLKFLRIRDWKHLALKIQNQKRNKRSLKMRSDINYNYNQKNLKKEATGAKETNKSDFEGTGFFTTSSCKLEVSAKDKSDPLNNKYHYWE
ncbi:hypothetical protein C1645_741509 [Glomus cerebriforme]|uniref:Uncharacterized protein n=1 Tax=Glomus cerebriforme TaxID=658196 RepID=A0A397SKV5_9GLOM|nr:hypothetical protein C1645_741509 [Glomus cerebriforme]